jgi:branched-chain amino acid transport system substrate-binding protein
MRKALKLATLSAAVLLAAACGKKEEPAPAPAPAPATTAPAPTPDSSTATTGSPTATMPSTGSPTGTMPSGGTPTSSAPPADAQIVRIGHVAPMSGPQAHYGKDNENGVRMAIEDLNAQGVTIGGKRVHFEIQAEDDAADPKQGTAAAQKLCDAKVAGVVGHLNSGTTIPAAKVYNDCGIPHITGAATNPALTKPGYKTTYRIIANDNALGAALALYAADKLKLKKVAVIDDRTAYGQGVAEIFAKTAKSKGMQVVDTQFTNDKATDFMAILTAIKAKNPDAIFYGGMDAQGGPMLRQLDQLGLTNVKFFGGDGICTSEIIKLAGGAKTLDNMICAEGGASLTKMPGGAAWKQKYDQKYPGQFQIYSPYTYDATFVLVDAMKRANSIDPKVYTPKLKETDFQGVTAKIQFEPSGELKNAATTLYTYQGGKKAAIE